MANNPYQYGNPVEPDHFVGRKSLVNQLANLLTYPEGRSIALVAGRRCGKTSLLFALADQLSQADFIASSSYHPFPIYLDMKGRPNCDNEEQFLKHLLADVIDKHVSPDDFFGRPERAWPVAIELTNAKYQELIQAEAITLYQFERAVRYILKLLEDETPTDAPVRLILLFDEVDSLLDEAWANALFNRLRTLVSSGEMRKQVRVVLSGSTQFLANTSERGSPLWNILDTHYLEPFDEDGFKALTEQFENLPGEVEEAVLEMSGGHPFLEQYLLYYLWEKRQTIAEEGLTDTIVNQFFSKDGLMHLKDWAHSVGTLGLLAFTFLAKQGDWVEAQALYSQLKNEAPTDVDTACTALIFHSFVEKDKAWRHYRANCGLLQRWLDQNFQSLLKEDGENAPDIITATLERARQGGNVTIIVGDQWNLDGDFRNSILNIKSKLDKTKQSVADTEMGSSDLGQQVQVQIDEITKILAGVPQDHDQTAEKLAQNIENLVEFALESQPDKELVRMLADRVKHTAEGLYEALPALPAALDELNQLILQMIG